jgi:hypothetical protein
MIWIGVFCAIIKKKLYRNTGARMISTMRSISFAANISSKYA